MVGTKRGTKAIVGYEIDFKVAQDIVDDWEFDLRMAMSAIKKAREKKMGRKELSLKPRLNTDDLDLM